MNTEKQELHEALQDLKQYASNAHGIDLLYLMCDVMSEDNLHEVVAALSQKLDYPTGYRFWYGSRHDFIDKDFWLE
ncbi:MAG: hypothetical protein J6Q19_04835 [Bacteroidaceae bacterium]|nr:hypothetical protein [Bacteroidaceae bacterium]